MKNTNPPAPLSPKDSKESPQQDTPDERELPPGWIKCRLEFLTPADAPIIYGILQPGPEQENGVLYVRPTEIVDDRIDVPSVRKTSPDIAKKYARASLKQGDVLLSIVGTIGKAARVPPELEGANITQSSCRIRPRPGAITSDFLFYQLKSPEMRRQFDLVALGTGVPRLNIAHVRDLNTALPPLPEQRRIVAKLDELLARSRKAREALEAIPPLLEKLRQSILAAAFRGDLTAAWREKNPDVEPASVLLQRIRAERRKKWEEAELAKLMAKGKTPLGDSWKDKYQEPEPVNTEGLPELPEGWCWAGLNEISTLSTGGTPPGKEEGCYGGKLPFFKPTDLDGGLHLTSARQTLSEKGASFLSTIPAGSSLITCIGATIGKTGMTSVECAANQQINAAHPVSTKPEYLYFQLTSPDCQQWIKENASATTLPIINKGRMEKMPIALAPEQEQTLIVSMLMGVEIQQNSSADIVDSQQRCFAKLEQALLAKAFRGELVPQDPADEPAEVMLERLRKEQEQAPVASKRGRKPKEGGTPAGKKAKGGQGTLF